MLTNDQVREIEEAYAVRSEGYALVIHNLISDWKAMKAEIERLHKGGPLAKQLQEKNTQLKAEVEGLREHNKSLITLHDDYSAENTRLREALEFYAESDNYKATEIGFKPEVIEDGGRIAKAVLEARTDDEQAN
jgi:cell division protein FtsB